MPAALPEKVNVVARELIEELIRAGKTEQDVADAVGRSQSVVSRIRSGAGTTLDVFGRLCTEVGRDYSFLLAEAGIYGEKAKAEWPKMHAELLAERAKQAEAQALANAADRRGGGPRQPHATWDVAKPLVKRRLAEKDPEDAKAVLESLEAEAFFASEDPTKGAGPAWWLAAADERYALLRSETARGTAAAAGATLPITKSQLGARPATELDDDDGYDPSKEEAAPHAQKGEAQQYGAVRSAQSEGMSAPSSAAPKTTTRRKSASAPGKVTGRAPKRAK